MNAETVGDVRWWGTFSIPENEERMWRIGPLSLAVSRSKTEWRVRHMRCEDPFAPTVEVDRPAAFAETDELEASRYGFRKTTATFHLSPLLASRPLVVNTEVPFYLLPGESTTLFISVPLWVRLLVGEPARELLEIPVYRPSDTWFGPSSMEGEMAFASRTSARLHLESITPRPHRALCAVRVINRADTKLRLEQLKLPMPNLSVFETADNQLWTEYVTLDRHEAGSMATIKLSDAAPAEAAGAKRLVKRREKAEAGLLTRAFAGIF